MLPRVTGAVKTFVREEVVSGASPGRRSPRRSASRSWKRVKIERRDWMMQIAGSCVGLLAAAILVAASGQARANRVPVNGTLSPSQGVLAIA